MVAAIYFITFIASLTMTGLFLLRNKKLDSVFVLFCILVIVNSMGRYLVSVSETLEMAIYANKFLYVGGCYCPLLLIIVLAQLCNLTMPNWLKYGTTLFSTVVLFFVFTIGKSTIYYKDVQLGHADGYNYLIKTYGPAHILYPILIGIYAVLLLFYLVYANRKKSKVSFKTVAAISVLGMAVLLTYIIERIVHSQISYLTFGYLLAILVMTRLFERTNMYDMTANVARSVEKISEQGYLIFDNKYRYVNGNTCVKELFPEIEERWRIDDYVPETDSYLYREVISWFLNMGDDINKEVRTICVGEAYYEVLVRNIIKGKNKVVGYVIEFIDRTSENQYLNMVNNYNADLRKEVKAQTADIAHMKNMIVLGMASMVESRDNSTGGHIKRTSSVVAIFANKLMDCKEEFGLSEDFLNCVERAAPMHDLGKIAVDDRVLRKQGRFTDEEYAEMKNHAEEGARIVENILVGVESDEFITIASNVARYHHEKWNGEGYPTQIAGEAIPIEARIMALADVFDALVSKRCYKEAFSYDKAFSIIKESLGSHFDPKLGEVFIKCREELEHYYDSLAEDS